MPGKLLVAFALCTMVASTVVGEDRSAIIGLIGDSTVATTYGWGPAFADRLNDQVTVLNYAKNGATLDSLSKKLDALIEQKPDYILIQFGHNDMKRYNADAYREKLEDYVERVRRSGCKPIVLSSVTRRRFDEDGKIAPVITSDGRSLPGFARAAESVAKEAGVPFIDLNTISIAHHNRIGPEASAAFNFNRTDKTHFSKEGADAIAALVLEHLMKVAPELAGYVK